MVKICTKNSSFNGKCMKRGQNLLTKATVRYTCYFKIASFPCSQKCNRFNFPTYTGLSTNSKTRRLD